MEIRTARLVLRPIGSQDAEPYGRLLAEPTVFPYTVEDGPVAASDVPARIARKRQQWADRSGATWAITLDGAFVGYVSLHGLGNPAVATSYAVLPEFQRNGFAREALLAVLVKGPQLGFQRVLAKTHHANEASAALLLALGFVEVEPTIDPPRRAFEWPAA